MVFNQKPRKPIIFTANSSKIHKAIVSPIKNQYSTIYTTYPRWRSLSSPASFKISFRYTNRMDFKQKKTTMKFIKKQQKRLLQRQNKNSQINSQFTPATNLKIGKYVSIPNFTTQNGISKKLQQLRNKPYHLIDKPTDVTYKLLDLDKKEIVQHKNNILLYYPKEYALRELTQLHSFTWLKIVQNKKIRKKKLKIRRKISTTRLKRKIST